MGETGRTLADRLISHLSDINTRKNKPVVEHFNEICHFHEDNLMITPIVANRNYVSKTKSKAMRLRTEAYWIRELNSQQPRGINLKLPVKRDIIVTLPFNKTSREAYKLFRNTFETIQTMYPIKYKDQLKCACRRNKNLGDYLVRSKLT